MESSRGRILIGVTGCIAAYKTCEVIRGLQQENFDVWVVATKNAGEFIGEATFDALTGHKTLVETFGDPAHPIPHIELAKWGDIFVIVPATANVIAKIASGIADDLLTSCALAAWDKLALAPAMNVKMFDAPSTQANIETLRGRGVHVIEPDAGYLACGDVGRGRLAEPSDLVRKTIAFWEQRAAQTPESYNSAPSSVNTTCASLAGKRVLVNAGPTYERIDEVRFLANRSSGKMGYALATAARDAGAEVTLVTGPTSLSLPAGVRVIAVESAQEMLAACEDAFKHADLALLAAAVADMRPKTAVSGKLKKGNDDEALATLELVPNPDILATLAASKRPDQVIVGFAAETDHLVEHARSKRVAKNADMIVANCVAGGAIFGADTNEAVIVTADEIRELPKMSKSDLAREILQTVCATMF